MTGLVQASSWQGIRSLTGFGYWRDRASNRMLCKVQRVWPSFEALAAQFLRNATSPKNSENLENYLNVSGAQADGEEPSFKNKFRASLNQGPDGQERVQSRNESLHCTQR